ncbi:MAG: DMT family transporter, partial [Psychrobium sp.]|nr:DMT family transporter [Psychrobium sp.]
LHEIKHQSISGLLIHGAYLGGVFAAIKWQMPAGITALLVSMQPLLTALITVYIHKKTPTFWQCCGLLLGFVGVILVLYSKSADDDLTLNWQMITAAVVALFGITLGSLYQKRFSGQVNLVSASVVQYCATAVLMGLITFSVEQQVVDWQWPLIGALLWLVFGLSVSAILLLLFMIKQGESAKVAAYFYLVPGVTAIEAWILFDETLPMLAIGGVLISVIGVYLTIRKPKDVG